MFNALAAINWLAVLVAFAAYYFLGAAWFAALFARPYRVSLGKEREAPAKMTPIFFVGPALCTLLVTVASAGLLRLLHITSYGPAAGFALYVGTGYLAANTVNIAINPNIPRPLLYGLISGSYHLVGILLASFLLVALS